MSRLIHDRPDIGPLAYLCGLLTVVFLGACAVAFPLLLLGVLFRALLK